MADKQLRYSIGVDVDTKQLLTQVNAAISALDKLGTGVSSSLTPELQSAAMAALDLSNNLSHAINQDTGKFDLLAFNEQLRLSNTSITDYAQRLSAAGTAGEEAFTKVAVAIASADLPLTRSNKLLDSLWVTMKNTMKWQLTSSVMRGFIGGVQTAYGYTQDLNESLNRIQIVTGKSAEQMAELAKQANTAAKALSTTTTNYTDAALIYYQQGLDDQEAKARTEATIKYANVSDISAETASEQLTAIWNNFAEGSENLEYYIDVMAKLGATTSSSSSEISAGLQKFAAVADTVGLSYEYAAAALATVTAKTRESAEVVGNAYKTLFSRIQGLQQGEEQDDGTTLNKYSEALAHVGISIKDTSGELKDMDTILDEMGNKWQTLAKDEQLALAETVAGVRQYTQLVALMDNWDYFQKNLSTAYGSSGTLEEQAETYASSWEAARDRVTAAAEDIYDSLINDDFYIDADNIITPLLSGIARVVDALGGMKGTLQTIGALVLQVYGDKMAQGIKSFAENIGISMDIYKEQLRTLQNETVEKAKETSGQFSADEMSQRGINVLTGEYLELKQKVNKEADHLNSSQKELLDYQTEIVDKTANQLDLLTQQAAKEREQLELAKQNILTTSLNKLKGDAFNSDAFQQIQIYTNILQNAKIFDQNDGIWGKETSQQIQMLSGALGELVGYQGALENYSQTVRGMGNDVDLTSEKLKSIAEAVGLSDSAFIQSLQNMDQGSTTVEKYDMVLNKLREELQKTRTDIDTVTSSLSKIGVGAQQINAFVEAGRKMSLSNQQIIELIGTLTNQTKNLGTAIDEGRFRVTSWADSLIQAAQTVNLLSMGIRGFTNLSKVFTDEDMSASQRFLTILTSLSMILPAAANGIKLLTKAKEEDSVASQIHFLLNQNDVNLEGKSIIVKAAYVIAEKLKSKAIKDDSNKLEEHTAAEIADTAAAAGAVSVMLIAAGVIAGVALAIYGLIKLQNQERDTMQKAVEVANEAKEAYEDVKSAYDNLKQSLSDYQDARDGLDELIKGTDEWKEAVYSLNEQVLSLMNSYPQLAKYIINSDGILEISKEGQEALIDQQFNGVQQSYRTSLLASNRSLTLTDNYETKQFSENAMYYKEDQDRMVTTINSVVDAINTYGLNILENSDSLQQVVDVNSMQIEYLMSNKEAVIDLANKITENTAVIELQNQQIGQSILESSESYSGSNYEDQLSQLVGNKTSELYNTYYDEYKDKILGQGYTDEYIQQEYAKLMKDSGYTWISNKFGNKGSYMVNGEVQEISDEVARAALAQAKAQEEASNDIDKYSQAIDTLTQVVNTDSDGVKNALANFAVSISDLSDLTAGDIEELQGADFSSLDEETLSTLGYDSVEELNEFRNKAIDDWNYNIEHLTDGMLESTKRAFNALKYKGVTDNLTLAGQQVLVESLDKAMKNAGQDGQAIIKSVWDSLDKNNVQDFADVLGEMDWDTQNPEDFVNALNEAGVQTGLTTDQLYAFAEALIDTSNKMNQAINNYQTGKEVLDDLATGDTISEEDYNKLDSYTQGFFTQTLDGMYMLMGSSDELLKHLKQLAIEGLDSQNKELELQNETLGILGNNNNSLNFDDYDGDRITAAYQTYIDLIEAYTDEYDDQVDYWRENAVSSADEITEAWNKTGITFDKVQDKIEENTKSIQANRKQIALEADSVQELESFIEAEIITEEDYMDGIINLASQYENCTDEIEKYQQALASGTEAQKAAAAEALELSTLAGEMAAKYDLEADEVENYAKRLQESDEALKSNANAAIALAVGNQRLERGLTDLNDNLSDYKKILSNSGKETAEWSSTMDTFKNSLADILNMDMSNISDSFAELALSSSELQAALKGDADAILALRYQAADDIILNLDVNNALDSTSFDAVKNEWANVKAYLENSEILLPEANQKDLVDSFNAMIKAGAMTKEQIEDVLAGLNVGANLDTTYVKMTTEIPTHIEHTRVKNYSPATYSDDGSELLSPAQWDLETWSEDGDPVQADTWVPQYQITGTEGDGTITNAFYSLPSPSAGYTSTHGTGKSGGSGGGGSSTKPKTEDTMGSSDETITKYHELDRELEYLDFLINKIDDDISNAATIDDKLDLEAQKVSQLNQQYETLSKKRKEAFTYFEEDKASLQQDFNSIFAEGGLQIEFDPETGEISNYEELEQYLIDKSNAARKVYDDWITNTYNKASADQQENLEDVKESYEDAVDDADDTLKSFRDAASEYESDADTYRSTLEQIRQVIQDLTEAERQRYELNLEKLEQLDEKLHVFERQEVQLDFFKNLFNNKIDIGGGTDYLKNLYGEQAEVITEQAINAQNTYNQSLQNMRAAQQDIVKNWPQVEFDENTGEITNYAEVIDSVRQAASEANAAVTEFEQNHDMTNLSDEEQEVYDGLVGIQIQANGAQDEFEKYADRYESSIDNCIDASEDFSDSLVEMLENAQDLFDALLDSLEELEHAFYRVERLLAENDFEASMYDIAYDLATSDEQRAKVLESKNSNLEQRQTYLNKQVGIYESKVLPEWKTNLSDWYGAEFDENGEIISVNLNGKITSIEDSDAIDQFIHNMQKAYNALGDKDSWDEATEAEANRLAQWINFWSTVESYGSEQDAYLDAKVEEAQIDVDIKNTLEDIHELEKKKNTETIQQLETIVDRYHEINRELEREATLLSKIETATDRAFGTAKLKNYADQISNLNDQIDSLSKKLSENSDYIQQDYNMLTLYGTPKIDTTTGELLNREELINPSKTAYEDYYNNTYLPAVTALNAKIKAGEEITDDEQTAYEDIVDELEILKTAYEDVTDAIEQYEDSLDTREETIEAWQDAIRSIEDAKLEEIIYKLDVKIQIKNMKQAADEFSQQIVESFGDAITHGIASADWSAEMAEDEAALLSSYTEQYNELKDYLANAIGFIDEDGNYKYATDVSAAIDQLEELQGKIISSGEDLLEWIDSLEELVPDAIDAASERLAQFTDQLEHNNTVLDTIKELYALQGVTYKTIDGFNKLQKVAKEQYNAQLASAKITKEWFDGIAEQLAEAEAQLETATEGTVAYDTLKANRDALLEEYNEAQEEYLEKAQEAMETARDMFLQELEKASYDFSQAISGGEGLDLLQDKYDNFIDEEGRYLDTVNELYQVNSWNLKLQNAIDEALTSSQKERLKTLQEEIDLRREGGTLSQYDLDILEAKYNLTLAQIALEDAENAKNQARLVRDSNGNWNYQFYADEDQIAQAQQDYLDAQNEYYNIAKNQVEEVTSEILEAWQNCNEKIKEIYEDEELTVEEKEAAIAEVRRHYAEIIEILENEKAIAIGDMNTAALESLLYMTENGTASIIDMEGNSVPVVQDMSDEVLAIIAKMEQEMGVTFDDMTKQAIALLVQMGVDESTIMNGLRVNAVGHITGMSDDIYELMAGMVTSSAEQGDMWSNDFANTLDDMTANTDKFEDLVDQYIDSANDSWESYEDNVKDVADATDTSVEDLTESVDNLSESTEELADAGYEAADSLLEQIDYALEASDAYLQLADSIYATVQALEELAREQATIAANAVEGEGVGTGVVSIPGLDIDTSTNLSTTTTTTGTATGIDSEGNIIDSDGNIIAEAGDYDIDWSALMTSAIVNSNSLEEGLSYANQVAVLRTANSHGYTLGTDVLSNQDVIDAATNYRYRNELGQTLDFDQLEWASNALDYTGSYQNNEKSWDEWLQFLGIKAYDTGGYTGEFNDGRLGLLHQKELVLNQKDTENILAAVTTMRSLGTEVFAQIERMLDGNVLSNMATFASAINSISMPSNTGTIEQDVKIEANFPSVTDRNEIEEAFNSLVNKAAQHVRRRTE